MPINLQLHISCLTCLKIHSVLRLIYHTLFCEITSLNSYVFSKINVL